MINDDGPNWMMDKFKIEQAYWGVNLEALVYVPVYLISSYEILLCLKFVCILFRELSLWCRTLHYYEFKLETFIIIFFFFLLFKALLCFACMPRGNEKDLVQLSFLGNDKNQLQFKLM